MLFLVLAPPQPSEPWWNPGGTLVEPSWNPRGNLPQGRPGPPRSLSGLTPQSFQLLGKKRQAEFPGLPLPSKEPPLSSGLDLPHFRNPWILVWHCHMRISSFGSPHNGGLCFWFPFECTNKINLLRVTPQCLASPGSLYNHQKGQLREVTRSYPCHMTAKIRPAHTRTSPAKGWMHSQTSCKNRANSGRIMQNIQDEADKAR